MRAQLRRWLAGKEFSCDWTSDHIPIWEDVLAPWRDRPVRILEIGSWEGRSALIFLNYLCRSTIVCIDTFEGSESLLRHDVWGRQIPHVEGRFDRNLHKFGRRVEKIKSKSVPALDALVSAGRTFDLAYIDASHRCDDVMADSVRTWRMLTEGGVIIWDDYEWRPEYPPQERPKAAIDAFLKDHAGCFKLLSVGMQVIIRRVS